jgi:hypothetical protein
VLQAEFPSWDRGSFSAGSPIYVGVSAVVVVLAWRPLRRWLPRRLHATRPEQPTLGYARGSLLWVTMLVPALFSAATTGVFSPPPEPVAAPALAAGDVCRDRAGLDALGKPMRAADLAIHRAAQHGPPAAVRTAFARRIPVRAGVVRALEDYEPQGSWGAAMKKRLVAVLARSVRADRGLLHREITSQAWSAAQRPLERAIDDLAKPIC